MARASPLLLLLALVLSTLLSAPIHSAATGIPAGPVRDQSVVATLKNENAAESASASQGTKGRDAERGNRSSASTGSAAGGSMGPLKSHDQASASEGIEAQIGRVFLVAEIGCFAVLCLICLVQLCKGCCWARENRKNFRAHPYYDQTAYLSASTPGGTLANRNTFIFLMLFSCTARALSLGVLLRPTHSTWLPKVIEAVPQLLFASTYSVVVLVWARVYYNSVLVELSFLRASFLSANVCVYSLAFVVTVVCFLLDAPGSRGLTRGAHSTPCSRQRWTLSCSEVCRLCETTRGVGGAV
eukprot:GHVU01229311.1.p1 GENE.GHVU01229311.1~~GHVU01229311.1.p1  ORF type:complete len:299 (+),score=45.64 GHVU01229311.1:178-1074(+)